MSLEIHPDFLARLIASIVARVSRHPRKVLVTAAVVTLAAILTAYLKLEFHTQRNDLLSAEKLCQQRWQKYIDIFGDDDDLVVVAEGHDRSQMIAALDAVAESVKQQPDLFDRVFYRVDLRHLQDRSLLYLPIEQLNALRQQIERMGLLLGPHGHIAWRAFSLQSLLGHAVHAIEAQHDGQALTAADRDLLNHLPHILSSASASLTDPSNYKNPWHLLAPISIDPATAAQHRLTEPQYFFTEDGTLALLTCRPKKTNRSFAPAREANSAIRTILAEVGPRHPDVVLGLTGIPVLETDEMTLSDTDSFRASCLALLGVTLLYFVVYRGCRYPLLTITTLVVGTIWALGWATITVGHLNILSATFAVMLIGLGDYGVLWVTRYDEARLRGETVAQALYTTAIHVGPSIVTAAATTGLAFFAIMLADFKAVTELGWIAGWGVLLCAGSCIVLMPALIVLLESSPARSSVRQPIRINSSANNSITNKILPLGIWLPKVSHRPRSILIAGIVIWIISGLFAINLKYDHNLLNLQASSLDSVQWEYKLISKAAGITWDALSIARTREEAIKLKLKYESLPSVDRVVEVATLIPDQQDAKLPIIEAIHKRLAHLPAMDALPTPIASNPQTIGKLVHRLADLTAHDSDLSLAARDLITRLNTSPKARDYLHEFDRQFGANLARELVRLKAVSRPEPITLVDIPPELSERYIGSNGEFLVRAFARENLWDYQSLSQFTLSAATVDPEATGKAFRTLEGLRQMKLGFEWAAIYALVSIVLVLLLDFQQFGDLLLALLPLGIGGAVTLGVLVILNVSLNPANMIALPLIVGVGVDNGVHVLHDYRARQKGQLYQISGSTGRGILVTALTTILGFGSLMTARHQGMASLGLTLTIGVSSCMFAALVILPAVLQLRTVKRKHQELMSADEPCPQVIARAA
jgi:hypothetical protein